MAQLLNTTRFKSPGPTAVSSFNVTIPATTPGAKLVCMSGGGAIITAKLGVGGTSFTKRTTSLDAREVSAQDIVDSGGGTTTIQITLNGPENVDGMIFEFAPGALGNFMTGSDEDGTGGNPGTTTGRRHIIGNITTTGPAVLFAMFTSGDIDTSPVEVERFWGFQPIGKQFSNEYIYADTSKTKYWSMIALSDQASAGTFSTQTSRSQAGNTHQSVVVAYEDLDLAHPTYAPYSNPIAAENSLPGDYYTTWFGNGTDGGIAGYTDSMSYLPGQTVNFKVDSLGNNFEVRIYRTGFYNYLTFGGRHQATVTGTPASQPAPTVNSYGGSVCNWSTTATWSIPSTAVPGIYVYIMIYNSTIAQGIFVVRSTPPTSGVEDKIMLTTTEFTWQAYNVWGATTDFGANLSGYTGRSLYTSTPTNPGQSGRAFSVSFNRPISTVSSNANTYFWDAAFGLNNFLEGNGYDLAYYSMTDLEKDPTIPSKYRIAVSSGHSEYWTDNLRDAYENARDAGTHLMFFSGNTSLWRVRFDPADTDKRNIICYKDSHNVAGWDGSTKYDPVSYTGTWRDRRHTVGGVNNTFNRPESGMTGQWFIGNGTFEDTQTVANTYRSLPIWRNTAAANAATITVRGTDSAGPTTAVSQVTLNQPSGTQIGDLLVVAITYTGDVILGVNWPLRFVKRYATTATGNETMVIYAGYAVTSGSGAHTVSWNSATRNVAATLVCYGNAVWEDPDASIAYDGSSATTHTTNVVASPAAGRWAIAVFGDSSSSSSSKTTSWTPGAGLTARVTGSNSGSVSGNWASSFIADSDGPVSSGDHQYSATAEFGNPRAFAGLFYIAPGYGLFDRSVGLEWDYVKHEEPTTPTNLVMLTSQIMPLDGQTADYNGATYSESGIQRFGISLYQADSGAYVFNAGSWRYPSGISRFRRNTNDVNGTVSAVMQQGLINILKDFGVAPTTLLTTIQNQNNTALVDPGPAATAADYGFPVTAPTTYQNIFGTTPPTLYTANDNTDYTLGTVFTAGVSGKIYGVRWHFPGVLPDTYAIGLLYSWTNDTSGTELARATFKNVTSGWNEVLFSSPVSISAGARYVAAVWTPRHYVSTSGQFASGAVTNGDLTAVQDTGTAHNGKLRSGLGGPSYPNASFGSNGYMVDIMFVGEGFSGWGIPT